MMLTAGLADGRMQLWKAPTDTTRGFEVRQLVPQEKQPTTCAAFAPQGNFIELTPIKQKGGKTVRAWAFEGDCEPDKIKSNTFTMEWPPRSGRIASFPEVDRAAFYNLTQAKEKVNPAQAPLLEELATKLLA